MSALPPFAHGRLLARLVALAALLGLGAFGCGSATAPSDPLERERERLQQARGQWRSQGIADYRFDFRRICFCAPPFTDPVRVTVRRGAIVAVERVSDAAPQDPAFYYTIEGLFSVLEEAIDQDANQLTASYDSALGYPTSAYIDPDAMIADEELGLTASDLQALR